MSGAALGRAEPQGFWDLKGLLSLQEGALPPCWMWCCNRAGKCLAFPGFGWGGHSHQGCWKTQKGRTLRQHPALGCSRHFRPGRWPGKQSSPPGGHEEEEPPVLHPGVYPIPLFSLLSPWTETRWLKDYISGVKSEKGTSNYNSNARL